MVFEVGRKYLMLRLSEGWCSPGKLVQPEEMVAALVQRGDDIKKGR